jgi:hypothetical protein
MRGASSITSVPPSTELVTRETAGTLAGNALCRRPGHLQPRRPWLAADTGSGGYLAAVALGSERGRTGATSGLSDPARPVRVRAVLEWGML